MIIDLRRETAKAVVLTGDFELNWHRKDALLYYPA